MLAIVAITAMVAFVFLDPVIAKATDWTETEINERAKWLATAAVQVVWKI